MKIVSIILVRKRNDNILGVKLIKFDARRVKK
jgi:hypothetical protein